MVETMIDDCNTKLTAIEDSISKFAKRVVDDARLSVRNPKKDFDGVISDLQARDMEGKMPRSKITEELKSYDIL